MIVRKSYLGDSVYATREDYGITLTTENGHGPTNTIFLEPEVYQALMAFVKECTELDRAATGEPT